MKLMIVEDDEDLSTMLARFLGTQGYNVCCASGAKEAIEILPKVKPSIVLLDFMLGDGAGTSVERFIRKESNLHGDVGIIYQTCVCEPEEKAMMLQHRADYVLNKPYKPDELVSTIDSLKESMADEHAVSKETGLLPLLAFERETDYHMLRNDAFEISLISILNLRRLLHKNPEAAKSKHATLSKLIKMAIQFGRLRQTVPYDIGPGIFGILAIAGESGKFFDALKETFEEWSVDDELDFNRDYCVVTDRFWPHEKRHCTVQEALRSLQQKLKKVEAERTIPFPVARKNGRRRGHEHWSG